MNDRQAIAQLQKNDTGALLTLIDTYENYVAKILLSFLGSGLSAQDLEEISSDVFFQLWQQRHRLRETESLKGYLAAIAKNTGRKRLRRMKTAEPLPDDYELVADDPTPQECLELSESQQTTVAVLAQLTKSDREIFYRHYYLRQTTREIAKLMQMNASTVVSRLARGRTKLKAKLGGRDNDS